MDVVCSEDELTQQTTDVVHKSKYVVMISSTKLMLTLIYRYFRRNDELSDKADSSATSLLYIEEHERLKENHHSLIEDEEENDEQEGSCSKRMKLFSNEADIDFVTLKTQHSQKLNARTSKKPSLRLGIAKYTQLQQSVTFFLAGLSKKFSVSGNNKNNNILSYFCYKT